MSPELTLPSLFPGLPDLSEGQRPVVRRSEPGRSQVLHRHVQLRKEDLGNHSGGSLLGRPHQGQQPHDGEGPAHHVHEHPLAGHPEGGLQRRSDDGGDGDHRRVAAIRRRHRRHHVDNRFESLSVFGVAVS